MCNCENNVLHVTSIVSAVPGAAGNLTLGILETATPIVCKKYIIRICVNLRDSALTGEEPLRLQINGVTYDVLTCRGEAVKVGNLRRRALLTMVFKFDTTAAGGHFEAYCGVYPLCLRAVAAAAAATNVKATA